MNAMKDRLFKLLSLAVTGVLLAGCYNDIDNPSPAVIMTDELMAEEGLTYISIKDLKQQFFDLNGNNPGEVASMTVSDALYTRGKAISNDRAGNIYKSLYIYDGETESAIELKLNTSNYIFYPVGTVVYVKLQDLVVGNYRGMLSIGTRSANSDYSNDNIENSILTAQHIFIGEKQPMLKADTLVVTASNYTTAISDADLGRLVRFEGVASKFGTAPWGYRNTYPNYFANSTSYDVTSPGWGDIPEWATWAAVRSNPTANGEGAIDTYYYGSAWFTYDATTGASGEDATPGNYVVRTSGYSSFRDNRIPIDGTKVDMTAIYTKYTSARGGNAVYQLMLNTDKDVVVK